MSPLIRVSTSLLYSDLGNLLSSPPTSEELAHALEGSGAYRHYLLSQFAKLISPSFSNDQSHIKLDQLASFYASLGLVCKKGRGKDEYPPMIGPCSSVRERESALLWLRQAADLAIVAAERRKRREGSMEGKVDSENELKKVLIRDGGVVRGRSVRMWRSQRKKKAMMKKKVGASGSAGKEKSDNPSVAAMVSRYRKQAEQLVDNSAQENITDAQDSVVDRALDSISSIEDVSNRFNELTQKAMETTATLCRVEELVTNQPSTSDIPGILQAPEARMEASKR